MAKENNSGRKHGHSASAGRRTGSARRAARSGNACRSARPHGCTSPRALPQTARIVNDALPQAAPVDAKKSEQSPGQQDMAAGSAAPAHHATSTAARRAEAKASSSHKEKDKERAKADGIVTAKAAKSAAKSKANSAQSQKPPAESDPDADLLTFLLQMRDPRKSPDTK